MLGRTKSLPSLTLSVLLVLPFAALGQDDPFAEVPPENLPVEEPASTSGGENGAADAGAGDAEAASDGEAAAESATTGDAGGSLEDEYGFDPAAEFGGEQDSAKQDPWEDVNRAIFRFNDTADRWVLKPLAVTYREVTPIFMQHGVSNFYGNLREVTNSLNSALQWKWGQAGNDAGRFLINTTVGVVGLFDVAQRWGLEPNDGEDFGQTLAVWGVPAGPYVVLPFLGPSTVRDVPGRWVDIYTDPIYYIDHNPTEYAFRFADLVQTRASFLRTESLLQGDRYVLLRDAYLQRREFLIKDGASSTDDDFGAEETSDETEDGEEGAAETDSEADPFAF
ncbi:putative phospholipid-binding lipoprotein MlaA precursor [Microbulbifer aggregans]|uniref:Putative phospholipid-binding lipoprotein MlaA n=1 Tax=Microbulbifer aggregans TaxID=1769779 RepID=A0A1C9W370_9GAMM|nr:VacJ family lipoprotein [Microbulbifer aggregans]AOS95587.1 putative phospholipid-binding lipoprotein MlaA precursor [Microbulbifer aggregans]